MSSLDTTAPSGVLNTVVTWSIAVKMEEIGGYVSFVYLLYVHLITNWHCEGLMLFVYLFQERFIYGYD